MQISMLYKKILILCWIGLKGHSCRSTLRNVNCLGLQIAVAQLKEFYKMSDHILVEVNDKQYLGVTLQAKLNWNNHIQNICKKANSNLGVLR